MPRLLHTLHTSHYYSSTPAQTAATLVRRGASNGGAGSAVLFICLAVIGVLVALGIWIGAKKAQLRSREKRPQAGWYRSRDGSARTIRSLKGQASVAGARYGSGYDDVEKGVYGSAQGGGSQFVDGFEMQTPAPSYYSGSHRSDRSRHGIRAPSPRYGYAMPESFQGSGRPGPSNYSKRGAATERRHFDVVPI
ncbi:hypothetical protein KC315_g15516 [Hortaea werneckii]|nr:hypothetical protein KC315_g15516 [Hortaea werneckii]